MLYKRNVQLRRRNTSRNGNVSDIILPCHCEEQRGLRRGNLAERNAPDGWIPTVTSFPRNDKGGTPTPDCHVERSRNISWKGNDVNYRKIVCLVCAPDGWIPTVTSFPRNDKGGGGTPTPERTPIQSVLIHGMCLFEVRAARRRERERRA